MRTAALLFYIVIIFPTSSFTIFAATVAVIPSMARTGLIVADFRLACAILIVPSTLKLLAFQPHPLS